MKNLIKGKLDPRAGAIWQAKWRGCRIQREIEGRRGGGAVQETHYLLRQSETCSDREASSGSGMEAGSKKQK